jgi:hypothetical protein
MDTNDERLFDEMYEKYGRPLEAEHWGEYLAVSRDGRTVLGTDDLAVGLEAKAKLGPGVFFYKIGPIAVGKLRSPLRREARPSSW